MMKKYFRYILISLFLFSVISFSGCGKNNADVNPSNSQETLSEEVSAGEGSSASASSSADASSDTEQAGSDKELPHLEEGSVKRMIRQGLSYVARSFGYSLEDRKGLKGNFDCSGFISVLLRDALGEKEIAQGKSPWATSDWRNYFASYQNGDQVQFGDATFVVQMKESYDFENAWKIPGSIVLQYPPENVPGKTMGHISIALGEIPYETTDDVIAYIKGEYNISLEGPSANPDIPKVYDAYGKDGGHTTWRLNANGVAKACLVDNHYSSDPAWIERIAMVFVPVAP